MTTRKRHRDDEAPGSQLPVLPRQADEPGGGPGDFEADTDSALPAFARAPTPPLGRNALAVRELQLAAERRISEADGRMPLSERRPGMGTARRFT